MRPAIDGSHRLAMLVDLDIVGAGEMPDIAANNRLLVTINQRGVRANHTGRVDHEAATNLNIMADSRPKHGHADLFELGLVGVFAFMEGLKRLVLQVKVGE